MRSGLHNIGEGFISGRAPSLHTIERGFVRGPDLGGAVYTANAVNFDGTNDFLTRGSALTGAADGKAGTFSVWFNTAGGTGEAHVFIRDSTATLRFTVDILAASDKLRVFGRNAAGTTILTLTSVGTYISGAGWKHLLASWNLVTPTGHLYVSDADDLAASPTLTDDSIDYTNTDFVIGARPDATQNFNGDLADFWFDDSYLDITSEANRRKFISAAGKPVDLGADGSTPTGSAPLVFLSGPTVNWHTNLGTGGGFTENGALADAATSPSD